MSKLKEIARFIKSLIISGKISRWVVNLSIIVLLVIVCAVVFVESIQTPFFENLRKVVHGKTDGEELTSTKIAKMLKALDEGEKNQLMLSLINSKEFKDEFVDQLFSDQNAEDAEHRKNEFISLLFQGNDNHTKERNESLLETLANTYLNISSSNTPEIVTLKSNIESSNLLHKRLKDKMDQFKSRIEVVSAGRVSIDSGSFVQIRDIDIPNSIRDQKSNLMNVVFISTSEPGDAFSINAGKFDFENYRVPVYFAKSDQNKRFDLDLIGIWIIRSE